MSSETQAPGHDSDRGQDREQPQPGRLSPFDPQTHYDIIESKTPVSEDGYKIHEPKWLRCSECGAQVLLTEEPSRGVDDLSHDVDCPQRFAHSEWYRERL
jgi:hypothetical protein